MDREPLRRYAVIRSLFVPTTLFAAIKRLGFVPADSIRGHARARNLMLRHREKNYRAGNLGKRPQLLAQQKIFSSTTDFFYGATLKFWWA